ncbi:MAG: hypothetical protein FJZ96_10080 [Chloroflexi bacterium]|nr:hypothetical protein [Chloroflexota bacterium]
MPSVKPSLFEKLKALGVMVGTASLPPPQVPAGRYGIESVVAGDFMETPAGRVFVSEQVFAPGYLHGRIPLGIPPERGTLTAWLGDPRLPDLPLESFAFLDTETSGLAGGTGTYAFLVGIGFFRGDAFHLSLFFMRDPAEEPALLAAIERCLAPMQALVTFNGKAFDAPLLATRYRLHQVPVPFEGCLHLDLLPLARRLWRDRLPSRALKYLEENILDAPRTSEEVPGYEIPYLYFDYLRSGDARPLGGASSTNAMDVVAMAALLNHIGRMLSDPLHDSIEHGLDRVALAKLFEDLGCWGEAARLYERGLEERLPEADFAQAVRRLSTLQRRRGDLEAAVRLWTTAAGDGHAYACVELAKHCEHRLRDIPQAIQWADRAESLLRDTDLPAYARDHWLAEIGRRRARLAGKRKSE